MREARVFQATNFEFRYRFWIFGALFWLAFASYSLDQQNSGAALVEWLARAHQGNAPDSAYRAVFAAGALFCIAAALLRTWATAYLNAAVMVDHHLHTTRLV